MSTVTRPVSVLSYGKQHLVEVAEAATITMTMMNAYLNFQTLLV
jgi:hypothetical protein